MAYVVPDVVSFTGSTQTACGASTSAVGPFYCPPGQSVYLDVSFFDELRDRFGASDGSLAEMYVVALEMIDHRTFDTGIQIVEYRPQVLERAPLAPADR